MITIGRELSRKGGTMSNVIGYYGDDELNCISCATEGEEATEESVPNGFTCATCGVVVNA